MALAREHFVTLTVAAVAALFIMGGFASLSGLSTYEEALQITLPETTFSKSSVFDVTVRVAPTQIISDETLMIYIDGAPAGVVVLKQYFDENRVDYTSEERIIGSNTLEVLSTRSEVLINLADYVDLDTSSVGNHVLKVEFSRENVGSEVVFSVE